LGQLILQQRVNQTMPGGLHLLLEGLGCDDESEVCLGRRDSLHRLVVRVEVRVVVDFERGGLQGGGNLCGVCVVGQFRRAGCSIKESQMAVSSTFCLIASSTGVGDAMVENGLAALARPEAARRNIGRMYSMQRREEPVGCLPRHSKVDQSESEPGRWCVVHRHLQVEIYRRPQRGAAASRRPMRRVPVP
jgi:hypothetical protein